MNTQAAIIGAAGLGVIAWALLRKREAAPVEASAEDATDWTNYNPFENRNEPMDTGSVSIMDVLTNPVETIGASMDRLAGTHISKMSQVTPDLLQNPNVRAILRVIRRGEGTSDQAGYLRIFGGTMAASYDDHPRIKITAGGYTSTAAGAYQFLASTWDETAKLLGLPDFSPASQDLAAVARIVYRKALDDVLRGDLDAAMPKLGKEWASMPGSPYGQPVISMQTAQATFENAGGSFA